MAKKRTLTVTPTVPLTTDKLKNHFVIVLDRSSSMGYLQQAAIKAFNDNVRAIREAATKFDQETTVSFITFGSDVRTEWSGVPVDRVVDLNTNTYAPYGNTALFDAVGAAIDTFEARPDARDPNTSFVVLVLTDGEENCSKRYTPYSLNALMSRVQLTDRYTLAFLLPPGRGKSFAHQYKVAEGNVREWEASVRGMELAAIANDAGTLSFFGARAAGAKSISNYYTTDLSTLTKADLSKMDDLSNNFKSWTIDKEEPIKEFVESHGIAFKVGAAHYLLMKKEKVQATKRLLVVEKGTKRIYGGAQARSVLGLPAGEVIVTPGNHANFDIYVQSTSVNRKLVRGTKLLYDKTQAVDLAETWDSKAAKVAADAKAAALAAAAQPTGFVPPGSSPFNK